MKASNLPDLWSSPDNSRLTSKQLSFRLPVHVAAKIQALCEMYPGKNRTQIVADLLASALEELEKGFPFVAGREIGRDSVSGETIHEDSGIGSRFRALADRHYIEMEKELGNPTPTPLYGGPEYDFKG